MKSPRLPVWYPYVSHMSVDRKYYLDVKYKGGADRADIRSILSILIYGSICPLDESVLTLLHMHGVPLVFHRRNMKTSLVLSSTSKGTRQDLLASHMLTRSDLRKRTYIARCLLLGKHKTLSSLSGILPFERFEGTITRLRESEARYSKVYWREYFDRLGQPEYCRRQSNDISAALDACSKFVSGILLRWITYHNLSPFHGFLHEPTDYPSLVYDLMEPYRYMIDAAVSRAYTSGAGESKLLPVSISELKDILHEEVYCVQTRQYVRRQELLHGVVLALRAYLLGLGDRFVVPLEGPHATGRPMKTNYVLPGKSAGFSKLYRDTHRLDKYACLSYTV